MKVDDGVDVVHALAADDAPVTASSPRVSG